MTTFPPAGKPSESPPEPEDWGELPEPPSPPEDWGDRPKPPDNFQSEWTAREVIPGGFVVERGVISAEAPMPAESSVSGKQPEVEQPSAISVSGKPYRSRSTGTEEQQPDIHEQSTTTGEESVTEISIETPVSQAEPITAIPTEVEIPASERVTISSPAGVAAAGLEPVASPPPSMTDIPVVAANESTIAAPPYISKAPANIEAPVSGNEVPAAPPYILPPTEAYAGQELHMITVILRPGGDKVRDNLRLRQCYGILISYSGHDRFALQIFERSRGFRIEFPNYTTTYCAELVQRLGRIVGQDNVIVEPLRLH